MSKRRIVGAVTIVLLLLAAVAYHVVFGRVESTPISGDITVLTRKNLLGQIGGNVVVYHDDQSTIVVDTQLSPLASLTRANVGALATAPVSTVLITHWHPDHSGGIRAFSTDSEVIAHENVLKRLSAPQEGFGLTKPGSHHRFDARDASGLPTQTLAGRSHRDIGAATLTAAHYPAAHTDGDLVVFFNESNVIAVGDLIWPDSFPYVDVHNGGSVKGLESALRALLAESQPGHVFVPGHGETLTFDDVVEYVDMISATRNWVESRIAEGQTLVEIVAADLPNEWEEWGSPLVPSAAWIEMIFASSDSLGSGGP